MDGDRWGSSYRNRRAGEDRSTQILTNYLSTEEWTERGSVWPSTKTGNEISKRFGAPTRDTTTSRFKTTSSKITSRSYHPTDFGSCH